MSDTQAKRTLSLHYLDKKHETLIQNTNENKQDTLLQNNVKLCNLESPSVLLKRCYFETNVGMD